MDEQQNQIVDILFKCVNNEELKTEEQQILDRWIDQSPHNKTVYDEVTNPQLLEKEIKALAGYDQKLLWNRIRKDIRGDSGKGRVVYFFRTAFGRIAVAAIFLLICAGVYFSFIRNSSGDNKATSENLNPAKSLDIPPGREGAILQLADGSTIVLDNAANGELTKQGNVNITKQDGQLSYATASQEDQQRIGYNTMTTPRGRQFRVVLADGSVVSLNAESSIKYPPAFAGTERRVFITGEAFFDVAKDASRPFRVVIAPSPKKRAGGEVEVLGTHFNINSYEDEVTIKTTLLEGLVKVKSQEKTAFLRPGQQAQISFTGGGDLKLVNDVDMDQVMSWKDNSFYFQDENIETIMRQIARWYDVEIVYEGKVNTKYTAIISRDKKVSDIFKALEASGGAHFRIEDNKIIVTP